MKVRVQELSEYAGYLISAKMDGIQLAVLNDGIYAALGVIGALACGAFVGITLWFVGIAAIAERHRERLRPERLLLFSQTLGAVFVFSGLYLVLRSFFGR